MKIHVIALDIFFLFLCPFHRFNIWREGNSTWEAICELPQPTCIQLFILFCPCQFCLLKFSLPAVCSSLTASTVILSSGEHCMCVWQEKCFFPSESPVTAKILSFVKVDPQGIDLSFYYLLNSNLLLVSFFCT